MVHISALDLAGEGQALRSPEYMFHSPSEYHQTGNVSTLVHFQYPSSEIQIHTSLPSSVQSIPRMCQAASCSELQVPVVNACAMKCSHSLEQERNKRASLQNDTDHEMDNSNATADTPGVKASYPLIPLPDRVDQVLSAPDQVQPVVPLSMMEQPQEHQDAICMTAASWASFGKESQASCCEEPEVTSAEEVGMVDDDEALGDCCRVCFEGHSLSDELVSPCACRGSSANVHISCLRQWHSSRGCPVTLMCPTCGQPYHGSGARQLAHLSLEVAERVYNQRRAQSRAGSNAVQADDNVRTIAAEAGTAWEDVADLVAALNALAHLLVQQGMLRDAAPLYLRAKALAEQALGPEHPNVATALNNLAALLYSNGDHSEAKYYLEQSLAVREAALGANHLDVAQSLNNLAVLLNQQGQYDEAQRYHERSLRIRQEVLGSHHPDVATSLNNLADLLWKQGKYDEAEPVYQSALRIKELVLGPDHPKLVPSLIGLAGLMKERGRQSEARRLLMQALQITEKVYGPDHPDLTVALNNLAGLLTAQGKFSEAETMLRRCLRISETAYGANHVNQAAPLNNLAGLLSKTNKVDEAVALLEHARAINERAYGTEHPTTAGNIKWLGRVYQQKRDYRKAQEFIMHGLHLDENILGPDHPLLLDSLSNLGGILAVQKLHAQAEGVFMRSLALAEKVHGPAAQETAWQLFYLGTLMNSADRPQEAIPMFQRALAIWERVLGKQHPQVLAVVNNLAYSCKAACVQIVV